MAPSCLVAVVCALVIGTMCGNICSNHDRDCNYVFSYQHCKYSSYIVFLNSSSVDYFHIDLHGLSYRTDYRPPSACMPAVYNTSTASVRLTRRKWSKSRVLYYNNTTATINIVLSGDVHVHPGPSTDMLRHPDTDTSNESNNIAITISSTVCNRISYSSNYLRELRSSLLWKSVTIDDCAVDRINDLGIRRAVRSRGRRAGLRVRQRLSDLTRRGSHLGILVDRPAASLAATSIVPGLSCATEAGVAEASRSAASGNPAPWIRQPSISPCLSASSDRRPAASSSTSPPVTSSCLPDQSATQTAAADSQMPSSINNNSFGCGCRLTTSSKAPPTCEPSAPLAYALPADVNNNNNSPSLPVVGSISCASPSTVANTLSTSTDTDRSSAPSTAVIPSTSELSPNIATDISTATIATTNCITVCTLNIHSLLNSMHYTAIAELAVDNNLDIIALTETWLKPTSTPS